MSWANLQADFSAWIKRTDLDAKLSGFVALFEAKAGRKLRHRSMETSHAAATAAGVITNPANWLAWKLIWQDDRLPMRPSTLEEVRRFTSTGVPTIYAVDGGSTRFNGAGNVNAVYYAAIPGLVASGSNWLSVAAYDAYLFGVLAEAHTYSMDEQRAQMYEGRSMQALEALMSADQRDRFSGPLVARTR